MLPVQVCEKLDKINRDFLWGSTNERRKMHMVGWSKIVKPKDEGRFGNSRSKSQKHSLTIQVELEDVSRARCFVGKGYTKKILCEF